MERKVAKDPRSASGSVAGGAPVATGAKQVSGGGNGAGPSSARADAAPKPGGTDRRLSRSSSKTGAATNGAGGGSKDDAVAKLLVMLAKTGVDMSKAPELNEAYQTLRRTQLRRKSSEGELSGSRSKQAEAATAVGGMGKDEGKAGKEARDGREGPKEAKEKKEGRDGKVAREARDGKEGREGVRELLQMLAKTGVDMSKAPELNEAYQTLRRTQLRRKSSEGGELSGSRSKQTGPPTAVGGMGKQEGQEARDGKAAREVKDGKEGKQAKEGREGPREAKGVKEGTDGKEGRRVGWEEGEAVSMVVTLQTQVDGLQRDKAQCLAELRAQNWGLVEVLQAARSAKERLQREVTAFEAQRDALLATHWEHMDANWTQQMQHLPLAQELRKSQPKAGAKELEATLRRIANRVQACQRNTLTKVLESMASVGQSFLSGQDMEGPLSTLTQLAQKTALVAGEEEGRSTLRDLLLHWGPRPDLPIALPPPTQGAEGSKGAAANVTPQPASQEVSQEALRCRELEQCLSTVQQESAARCQTLEASVEALRAENAGLKESLKTHARQARTDMQHLRQQAAFPPPPPQQQQEEEEGEQERDPWEGLPEAWRDTAKHMAVSYLEQRADTHELTKGVEDLFKGSRQVVLESLLREMGPEYVRVINLFAQSGYLHDELMRTRRGGEAPADETKLIRQVCAQVLSSPGVEGEVSPLLNMYGTYLKGRKELAQRQAALVPPSSIVSPQSVMSPMGGKMREQGGGGGERSQRGGATGQVQSPQRG